MKTIKEKKKECQRLRKSARTRRVIQRKPSSEPVCRLCLQEPGDPEKLGEFLQKDNLSVHYFCLILPGKLFKNKQPFMPDYSGGGDPRISVQSQFGQTNPRESCLKPEVILSSKLPQRGQSNRGFHGFLPEDIKKEAARASRKICFVCKKKGAAISCQKDHCVRNFHLPCGQERGCLSQFFGEYKSFCGKHRPTQDIQQGKLREENCVLCCEDLSQASVENIQSPCCSQTIYHRKCIQKYAHTSAKHFFKCPQCNNREEFPQEMLRMGIHIPDRDAAWELEPGAFSELYQRYQHCDAPTCLYEQGRDSFEEEGKWCLVLCATCGSHGTHRDCSFLRCNGKKWECEECSPSASATDYVPENSNDLPCCSSMFHPQGQFCRDSSLGENPGPSWNDWPRPYPESSGGRRSHSWQSKGVKIPKSCKKSQ